MGNAKKKLSDYHEKVRNGKSEKLHQESADLIFDLLKQGYTINDLCKCGIGKYKLIKYYLEKYELIGLAKINGQRKIANTARINGTQSIKSLGGVELKPLTDEIKNWYIEAVNSGMYRMQVIKTLYDKFGYGRKKYGQLVELYGKPKKNPQKGSSNYQYGKPAPAKSGSGIKAHIIYNGNKIFCRSLLELRIYLFLIKTKIPFELSKHRIEYINENGHKRTYNPDIVFMNDNSVCEIKPVSFLDMKINKIKFEAAKKYCSNYNLAFKVITERTYDLSEISLDYINNFIEQGIILINENEYKRLIKNIK